jgi:O-antigen biosynthesis protein
MAAETAEIATIIRPRVPLRRQLEQTPADGSLPPAPLSFHPASDQACGDRDVLFGYHLFLGRDPENSFVIASAKANSVQGFLRGVLSSTEFQGAVITPMQRGQAMPHERTSLGPSPDHIAWLVGMMAMPPQAASALYVATSWREFFTALTMVPGISLAPPPAESAPAPVVAAADADEDFLLVTIDQPKPGERLHPGALITGNGWAIAGVDIVEVAVWLDDVLLTQARYGLPRPDVARNFPHYRHVDHCGFSFSAQVPQDIVLTRQSQLVVAVRTVRGQTARQGIRIEPPARAAAPSTWPIRLFVEDVRLDPNAALTLRGWALARARLVGIAVYLADTLVGEADIGLTRPDIASTYGDYPNAAESGFVFDANLRGFPPGPQALRVQATDEHGTQRQAIVPVTVPALASPAHAAPAAGPPEAPETIRFSCDEALLTADGSVQLDGWALADDGISEILALHGDEVLGAATLGGRRPDVARVFRDHPNAGTSGFRLSAKAGDDMPLGATVTLVLRTNSGDTRTLELPLEAAPDHGMVDSAPGEGMRLEIDQPALLGDAAASPIRGALTIDGWAVSLAGIAGITVLRGGKVLGEAYVGRRREDIARAFPHHTDALRAGFALVLPPGALTDGEHQLEVIARSRDGATTQRRFTVHIEPADAVLPASKPRTCMPRAEQAFAETLLANRGIQPHFRVLVHAPAPRGGRADALAPRLLATLASLAAQVYRGFGTTLLLPTEDACRVTRAALKIALPGLADAVECNTAAILRQPADGTDARPSLVMILRAGDVLGCDALLELAVAHAIAPQDGFIYGDDTRRDPAHGRDAPFYKPDFSPELLLAMDYIGRAWCATLGTIGRAGLDLAGLAALHPYAAALRLTAAAPRVGHVAKVLASIVPDQPEAQLAALRGELKHRGVAAKVIPGPVPGVWRTNRRIIAPGLVSVIIPTAGSGGLIRKCLASLRATTAKGALEFVILDNVPASDKKTKSWLRRQADKIVEMPPPFNWSRFNNAGARAATGQYLLFLNDDVEALQPGWLEALLEQAQQPATGVVGARLLYPDGKVQHSGQYLAETHARHTFRFLDSADHGPFGLARVAREMSAVTGACQMVRRDVFDRLGGFDEAHDVINNDLDFCLRAQARGYAVIFTPHAELLHHELASRADVEDTFDAARFTAEWRVALLRGDPYHSRRLMEDADHCAPEPEPVLPVFAGPAGPAHADVRRILAVKLDHIGDYLTALPALRALKDRFPQAHLTLLAPPATAALARREPWLDAVLEFTFFHARSADGARGITEGELDALAARLAPEKFDVAIDLRMQPETRAVLRHTGAKLLVGYDQAGCFPWLNVTLEWEGDLRLLPKQAHIADRLLTLVAALETACRPLPAPRLEPPADPAGAPGLAALPADFRARRLICIHPGVGNPVRQWSAASFAGLIDLLAAELGAHVVLVGGGDELMIAEEVLSHVTARDAVVSLVGAIKLADLPGVMRACALFVGNNSGPKHLAASLGVPTVGIHSAVVDATEWAPVGAAAMALQRRVICGPCYLEFTSDCPRGMACLTGIKPRDVLAACRRLLAMRPATAAESLTEAPVPGLPAKAGRRRAARAEA